MAKGKMKNIEIVIRFIFIILFLVSFGSVSMGGVGDVYYCDETINLDIKNHKIQKYKLGKFKFKWEEYLISFGSGAHFFKDDIQPFKENRPSQEAFVLVNENSITKFRSGDFYYSSNFLVHEHMIVIITATCSKF